MTISEKRANKETLIILNKFNLINKIPKSIFENMQKNQDENWEFIYDDNLELSQQKISRQTAILFTTLYYMYICEDTKEKDELKIIYKENDKKYQKNNDFEDFIKKVRNNEIAEKQKEVSNLPTTSKKRETLISKILKWFKKIFK